MPSWISSAICSARRDTARTIAKASLRSRRSASRASKASEQAGARRRDPEAVRTVGPGVALPRHAPPRSAPGSHTHVDARDRRHAERAAGVPRRPDLFARRYQLRLRVQLAQRACLRVKPGDCRTLEDLRRFPFTTKTDLRETYPFGMFAVPMDRIVRIHASSGTTGKPTVVGYTARDIEMWTNLMARSIRAAGARPGDKVDRKSTRLNSSHTVISYAVFCLKKKKNNNTKNTSVTVYTTLSYK